MLYTLYPKVNEPVVDVFNRFNTKLDRKVQSNFNGSNTFKTMQISSRQGKFETMRVDYSARSGGLIGIAFLIFLHIKVCCVFSLELPH